MDQVHVVRHQVLVEGRSQRSVAREHGVSRNTVQVHGSERAAAGGEQAAAALGDGASGASSGGVAGHMVSPHDGEAACDG